LKYNIGREDGNLSQRLTVFPAIVLSSMGGVLTAGTPLLITAYKVYNAAIKIKFPFFLFLNYDSLIQ
jgi:hypothetical protein